MNYTESICEFGSDNRLVGILTEPKQSKTKKYAVLLLNAGMLHRVGPAMVYVDMSRKLAELGYYAFRFDLSGIGDSEQSSNNSSFIDQGVIDTQMAIAYLKDTVGIDCFFAIGICSGADIAIKASVSCEEIIGACPINGSWLDDETLNGLYPEVMRNNWLRYNKKNLFNFPRWFRLCSKLFDKLKASSSDNPPKDEGKEQSGTKSGRHLDEGLSITCRDWEQLLDKKVKIYQIISEGSLSYDIFNLYLKRKFKSFSAFGDDHRLEFFKNIDHTFTPYWSKACLIEKVTGWVKESAECSPR